MSMDEQIPVSLSYWQDVRKRFFGNKISIVGLVILVALVLAGIIGPFISVGNTMIWVQISWLAQELMDTGWALMI